MSHETEELLDQYREYLEVKWPEIQHLLDGSIKEDASILLDQIDAYDQDSHLSREITESFDASVHHPISGYLSPEAIALVTATAIFSKAFLETMGNRAGDGVANLPKRVADLVRTYTHRKDKSEFRISLPDGQGAIILVTPDLPDEARLALLDLDVTAEEVRGKTLRWDSEVGAWLPDDGG